MKKVHIFKTYDCIFITDFEMEFKVLIFTVMVVLLARTSLEQEGKINDYQVLLKLFLIQFCSGGKHSWPNITVPGAKLVDPSEDHLLGFLWGGKCTLEEWIPGSGIEAHGCLGRCDPKTKSKIPIYKNVDHPISK